LLFLFSPQKSNAPVTIDQKQAENLKKCGYSATVALEFFAQKTDVSFIATEKQWAAAGYRITAGAEAIHFMDENGNHSDLYDFSQIESNIAPRLWTIDAENVGEFKTALGISEETPILKAVMEQTVENSQVTECMEALGLLPKVFEHFKKSYINAVQTIIAGRFEIGGNKFNVNPDLAVLETLNDNQKIHFLTLAADTAKNSLLKVEKIANEIAVKKIQERNEENERNQQNDVTAMGKSDGGTAEQHTGKPIPDNTAGGITERSDNGIIANCSTDSTLIYTLVRWNTGKWLRGNGQGRFTPTER
jgi:hypothetical protein